MSRAVVYCARWIFRSLIGRRRIFKTHLYSVPFYSLSQWDRWSYMEAWGQQFCRGELIFHESCSPQFDSKCLSLKLKWKLNATSTIAFFAWKAGRENPYSWWMKRREESFWQTVAAFIKERLGPLLPVMVLFLFSSLAWSLEFIGLNWVMTGQMADEISA